MSTPRRRAPALAAALLFGVLALVSCVPEPAGPVAEPTTPEPSLGPTPQTRPPGGSTPLPTVPEAATPTPDAGGAQVTIITADRAEGALEVTGIVVGQTDAGATCVLTASKDGQTRSAEGAATPSGENSYCPLLTIPADALGVGSWVVVLSYRGDDASGSSSPLTVEMS